MHTSENQPADRYRPPGRSRRLPPSAIAVLISLQLVGAAVPGVWPTAAWAATTRLTELASIWRDDRGQPFDLRALQGRPVVLTMAYATCHRVCPMTLHRLEQIQRDLDRIGATAEFLVVGYDPDSDDPTAWHQYRETRHLHRGNWHFLTGTRATVEQTARQLGFKFWRDGDHVMHDSRILYFDQSGTETGIVKVSDLETTQR